MKRTLIVAGLAVVATACGSTQHAAPATPTTVVQIGTAISTEYQQCKADGLFCTIERDSDGSVSVYGRAGR